MGAAARIPDLKTSLVDLTSYNDTTVCACAGRTARPAPHARSRPEPTPSCHQVLEPFDPELPIPAETPPVLEP